MHSNFQTFRFAIIVTLVCSLLLASAATFLKPRQVENEALDIKKNILKAAGVTHEEQELTRDEIQNLYTQNILELVINEEGLIVEGKSPLDIDPKNKQGMMALYESISGDQVNAYIIPISGKGLWSTIYGYLAVEPDGKTIKGITFYKHGETPGLGGEVDKKWFTDNYIGKKFIDDNGELVSVTVARGKAENVVSEDEIYHYVDGISGATLTGRGINNFLKKDLQSYEPFFSKLRFKEGETNG